MDVLCSRINFVVDVIIVICASCAVRRATSTMSLFTGFIMKLSASTQLMASLIYAIISADGCPVPSWTITLYL